MRDSSRPLAIVFGGTGRLGRQILSSVQDSFSIRLLSRRSNLESDGWRTANCDVSNPNSVRDALISLDCWKDLPLRPLGVLFMTSNGLTGSSGIIDSEFRLSAEAMHVVVDTLCDLTQADRHISLVYLSSAAVTTFPEGGLSYGVGKLAGEFYCSHMAHFPPSPNWRFNAIRVGHASRDKDLTRAVGHLSRFLLSDDSMGISGQIFSAYSPQNIGFES